MLTVPPPSVRSLAIWRRCTTVRSKSNPRPAFRIRPAYRRTPFSTTVGAAPFEHNSSTEPRGFEVAATNPRRRGSEPEKLRSWFGPNGQYIRELPCPNCRGRGYSPCTGCGIDRPRSDCNLCSGEGKTTCQRCRGDCVIWEEFIDEKPWEKAWSRSPLKVKEDDEVDNLEIKFDVAQKSKRIYKSPTPEVVLKISQSLKSLNEKTGLFTKHMKMVHQDPVLRAQRIASIKKTKGAPEARKQASEIMKIFFSDPENRRKRSLSMKGVKFFCSNCGEEGHRKFYCPLSKHKKSTVKFRCSLCGKRGHNRRSCSSKAEGEKFRCSHCGEEGHRRFYCPELREKLGVMQFKCGLCGERGHNRRSCTKQKSKKSEKETFDKHVDLN
ncbi:Zinc knuckle (CCHC-type) family protein [Rhynchospora pubera]|uniref:Zinc knuckle (CCHC-type) family protein n=1 Tax=Rhynchospora pubera TaxID=906938 RepID=A0AAV8EQX9_9POAL|nr:Zinc knuckle (CCHC-type) family protein [Rhynchospora pubera]